MNAWEDAKFVAAVKATGRRRLVMAGIVTSVCLAYPVVDALAAGYEVSFVEDAVGDVYKEWHENAVLRLAQAGAIPRTTAATITEWFRDWKSPFADHARKLIVVEAVDDDADRQAEEGVDAAHPLRVAAGEIVVHRNNMDALAL